MALVPTIYGKLAEEDPVRLEPLLRTAAEQRDRLTIATVLAAPAAFPLVSEPLANELRETMAGARDPEQARILKRFRELIAACERVVRDFRAQLAKDAPELVPDLLEQMADGSKDGAQPDRDPIATMAKASEALVA
jgi:hypothetical protein